MPVIHMCVRAARSRTLRTDLTHGESAAYEKGATRKTQRMIHWEG